MVRGVGDITPDNYKYFRLYFSIRYLMFHVSGGEAIAVVCPDDSNTLRV
jgi:hypothetical protein